MEIFIEKELFSKKQQPKKKKNRILIHEISLKIKHKSHPMKI